MHGLCARSIVDSRRDAQPEMACARAQNLSANPAAHTVCIRSNASPSAGRLDRRESQTVERNQRRPLRNMALCA